MLLDSLRRRRWLYWLCWRHHRGVVAVCVVVWSRHSCHRGSREASRGAPGHRCTDWGILRIWLTDPDNLSISLMDVDLVVGTFSALLALHSEGEEGSCVECLASTPARLSASSPRSKMRPCIVRARLDLKSGRPRPAGADEAPSMRPDATPKRPRTPTAGRPTDSCTLSAPSSQEESAMNIGHCLSRRRHDQRAAAEGAGAHQHPGGYQGDGLGTRATARNPRDDVRRASRWYQLCCLGRVGAILRLVIVGFLVGCLSPS